MRTLGTGCEIASLPMTLDAAGRGYVDYRPDWTSRIRNPGDGLNLVFPGERGSHDADSIYSLILVSESYRFGSEAGLADLVR